MVIYKFYVIYVFFKVIDCYLSLLDEWDKQLGGNSIFLAAIDINFDFTEYANNIQRRQLTLETKYLFCPMHINKNHWVIVVVDIKEKSLNYFDSMKGSGANQFKYVIKCLNILLPQTKWSQSVMSETIVDFPLQKDNTTECGIFLMMYADYFLANLEMDFSLEDMPKFRIKIFTDLVRNSLNYTM